MQRISSARFAVMISILAATMTAHALHAAPPDADPMAWSPPAKPPELRDAYSRDEYDTRFAAALEEIRQQIDAAKDWPDGLRIVYLWPRVDNATDVLKVGDIITKVDGGRPPPALPYMPGYGPDDCVVYSPASGQSRDVHDPNKLAQITWQKFPDRLHRYLRGKERDAKWDDAMLVAIAAGEAEIDDAPLAEMALHQAQLAGYRGDLLPVLSARLAQLQGRYTDAMALGWPSLNDRKKLPADPNDAHDLLTAVMRSAQMDFKLTAAEQLYRKFPNSIIFPGDQGDLNAKDIQRMVDRYLQSPRQPFPPPTERLQNIPTTEMAEEFHSIEGNSNPAQWAAWFLAHQKDGYFKLHGHTASIKLLPGLANLDAQVTFNFKSQIPGEDPTGHYMAVGLFDANSKDAKELLEVRVQSDGGIVIQGRPTRPMLITEMSPRPIADSPQKPGDIRITLIGQQVEVNVNGRRVYYGPAFSDEVNRRLGLWIMFMRINGETTSILWNRVDMEKEADE